MNRKSKKRIVRKWGVSDKLEVVQARQKGLTLKEILSLYNVGYKAVSNWVEAYERGGLAALEQTKSRNTLPMESKTEAAAAVLETLPVQEGAGIGKIQGALYRHGFLKLAKETVRRLLDRKGMLPLTKPFRRKRQHPKPRFFERAAPNDMWQTDIMTFMIKGQYRVYMIAFIDDHSRFITGWGLFRFQTQAHVMEVFRAAIEKHGMPKEVLSDNVLSPESSLIPDTLSSFR